MIYDEFKLDDFGKATICPVCQNEEIEQEDEYCKICGTGLINRCTRIVDWTQVGWNEDLPIYCDGKVSGNSRYCSKCGEKTTYFESGVLLPWRDEYKANRKAELRYEHELIEEEIEEELEEERIENQKRRAEIQKHVYASLDNYF